jgi:acid stress chaperone HdeA
MEIPRSHRANQPGVSPIGAGGTSWWTTAVMANLQEDLHLKPIKVTTSVLAAGVVLGAMVSGCGAKAEGGDTSCKDYTAANDADQQTAVSKMLKDEKGTDAAQLEITGTKLSVQTFCQTAGKQDSKIKEAPHL